MCLQAGEEFFRVFAGEFEVKRIRAHIDRVAPKGFAEVADAYVFEKLDVLPCGKHTLSNQVRKVDLALCAVFVPKPESVVGPRSYFNGAGR